jgi:hypothetical protein
MLSIMSAASRKYDQGSDTEVLWPPQSASQQVASQQVASQQAAAHDKIAADDIGAGEREIAATKAWSKKIPRRERFGYDSKRVNVIIIRGRRIQVLNGVCRLINQMFRLLPAIQRCVHYTADGILHDPKGKLRRSTGCLALSQAERSADTSAHQI